jgi:hypothetical protein
MDLERDTSREDRTASVFEPDTLLASQYFDRVRARAPRDAERRLMIAVLEDAVRIYLKHAGSEGEAGELFRETEEWVEDRAADHLYAFENICVVLDLDAEYLRRGLRARKAQARRRPEASNTAPDDGEAEFREASRA